jgi:hypothetical protein
MGAPNGGQSRQGRAQGDRFDLVRERTEELATKGGRAASTAAEAAAAGES